jgi:hypothetical protein
MPSRDGGSPAPLFSLSISTFSSSVICASRRAARSSGGSDAFIHGQSGTEVEDVVAFSIYFLLLSLLFLGESIWQLEPKDYLKLYLLN